MPLGRVSRVLFSHGFSVCRRRAGRQFAFFFLKCININKSEFRGNLSELGLVFYFSRDKSTCNRQLAVLTATFQVCATCECCLNKSQKNIFELEYVGVIYCLKERNWDTLHTERMYRIWKNTVLKKRNAGFSVYEKTLFKTESVSNAKNWRTSCKLFRRATPAALGNTVAWIYWVGEEKKNTITTFLFMLKEEKNL